MNRTTPAALSAGRRVDHEVAGDQPDHEATMVT